MTQPARPSFDTAMTPEQRIAAEWVRDNWSDADCAAVMAHVFTAPPEVETRRARYDWCQSNRITVNGVSVNPAVAWHQCFKAQRPLTVLEADPACYLRAMFDRYRQHIVFAPGLKALGIHESGVHVRPDGKVDVYAPDGMGRPCIVLCDEDLADWQHLLT